ncbi:MAG: DUF2062 domain-containing protein [Alphaproteobacteria bacterium]|nr:DUF2062 domain-containing protein [Alphaproteobacteria bacterium]
MSDKKNSFFRRIVRLLNLKLIVPLKRSPHPPEYTAKGVMIGMIWAMTPLVGIQMTTVLLTWLAARKFFKWDFSLPIALAYTWVTNVFTMWPIYYVFYATGKIMMGDFNISAFSAFAEAGRQAFAVNISFWEISKAIMLFVGLLMKEWGLAMAIGCIPWAIVCGWLSYRLTLKWLHRRAERKGNAAERRAYWRAKLSAAIHIKKRKLQKSQKLARFKNINHGFCNRFNTDKQKDIITFEKQLHSIIVFDPAKSGTMHLEGDAFVTSTPGLKIAVKTADCAPVLMTDGKVIASVHAGWKGAVSGVVESALLEMLKQGADLNKIVAVVGPCIHEASYPNPEVKKLLSEDVARFVPTYPDGVTHFNLPGYVMYRLEKAGISDIDLIDIDTYTDDDFYSYRRDPNNPGRQYTFIELKNE